MAGRRNGQERGDALQRGKHDGVREMHRVHIARTSEISDPRPPEIHARLNGLDALHHAPPACDAPDAKEVVVNSAKLTLKIDGKDYVLDLPVVVGTEHEVGIDIRALREKTGVVTLDPGFGNTGSCTSA